MIIVHQRKLSAIIEPHSDTLVGDFEEPIILYETDK